jgi:hypothetical protein
VELNYLSLEKSRDFRKSVKEDAPIKTAAKLEEFEKDLENISLQLERNQRIRKQRRELKRDLRNKGGLCKCKGKCKCNKINSLELNKIAEQLVNAKDHEVNLISNNSIKNYEKDEKDIKISKEIKPNKQADQEINVFIRELVGLSNLPNIIKEYNKINQYLKTKFSEIKNLSDKYSEERKHQIQEEHRVFQEAKKRGIKAVIRYKESRDWAKRQEKLMMENLSEYHKVVKQEEKKLKELSKTMNYRKPQTEKEKLLIGKQNYLHTEKAIKTLSFYKKILIQVHSALKEKKFIKAADIYESHDYKECYNYIIDKTCLVNVEFLFTGKSENTGFYISIINGIILEIDKSINWYNNQQKKAIGQVYDAKVQ